MKVEPECMNCRWYRLCRGGCRRDREDFRTGELSLSYLCPAYKEFFPYAIDRLVRIAEAEKRARATF